MKQFTVKEAYDYIKKNGITEFRLTEDLVFDSKVKIEKGEKIWFGVYEEYLSTFDENTQNRNVRIPCDYEWSDVWHDCYIGKLELVEEERSFPEYAMTKDNKIIKVSLISQTINECEQFYSPKYLRIATKEEYEASQGISIEEAEKRLGVKIKR
jgi:hypothetical protein